MMPLLNMSTNPRIVNVSSESGALNGMDGGTPAYGVSIAALNALTLKLAKELPNMKVNAVCPGWIATDMGGAGGGPIEDGGASVVWACKLGKDGPTGGFFRNGEALRW
jgi:NAD(P)-dependent dehydrogenase (short-subunit alcohol dehydrogenase family)